MSKIAKYNFKVGDTVKLKGSYCGISGNDTGKVVEVRRYVCVLWDGYLLTRLGRGRAYPHKPQEIEYAARVGEQLMFSFMTP